MPLRTQEEFNQFYKTSKSFHTKYFVIFLAKDNKKRFSVIASKKIGKAVKRNFAKRRLRALFISNKKELDDSIVLVAKKEILEADFKTLKYLFYKGLKRLS